MKNKIALVVLIIIVSVWMAACVVHSEHTATAQIGNYQHCVSGEQYELCAVNAPSVY